ncbi:failed axon connections homolog isoform x3 [Plakobranchus ocellatus]|uniref:Failed axon connections homolog isoform x3 n=1 Tax=Plakobranchus ocellatus TaxID=259542 RepID=A0AAV3ZMN2_9GAST|nr:failed axon connections homolog isoform x3 [Plakobranchus ocellatus]
MEQIKAWVTDHPYVTAGVVALATAQILHTALKRKKLGIISAPPNTVVLYQISRAPFTPSMTPFAVKLETYLRLAKIPYQNDFRHKRSSKGKFPWISYNGEPVADSQLAMEYLNTKLGVDLNKDLKLDEKAKAHAFRVMVDEHMYWCLVYFRWIYDRNQKSMAISFPWWARAIGKFIVAKQLHAQGMGRHTVQEVKQILMQDLEALSDQLGEKPFLMGENPCEVDCSVFGMLAQFVFSNHDNITQGLVQEHFPNLYLYTLRMKGKLWPDWEDCTTKGGKVKATK